MELAAAWLSPRVLLVAGPAAHLVGEVDALKRGGPVTAASLSVADELGATSMLHLVRFETAPDAGPLHCGDVRTLCRDRLARLPAPDRARIMQFLTTTLTWHSAADEHAALSHNLFAAREALRERLPYSVAGDGGVPLVRVDAVIAADDRSFIVTGSVLGDDSPPASVMVWAPDGRASDLAPRLCRHRHRSVEEALAGFTGLFVLDSPAVLADGWRLEWRLASGGGVEVKMPRAVSTLATARRVLLDLLTRDDPAANAVLRSHIGPALDCLHRSARDRVSVDAVAQHGDAPAAPRISIVVPLGEHADRIEHQLAQFARDAEIADTDLIYVRAADALSPGGAESAAQLFALYRVPFRVVTLREQCGFAAAIDAALTLARGRLLVVLSPETLPVRPGWLSRMAACHDEQDVPGVIAPRLLQADGTPLDVPSGIAADGFMIDRDVLHAAGGFCGRYISADFEVADLCLRLNDARRLEQRHADVELYALREESRFGATRHAALRYDAWVHAQHWPALT